MSTTSLSSYTRMSRSSSHSSSEESFTSGTRSTYSSAPGYVKDSAQRFLKREFDCIFTMADDIPEEMESAFAEHVVAFCDSLDVLEDLLFWVVKTSVQNAESQAQVLQPGLLHSLMMNALVNDRSEVWTSLLYTKIMERIKLMEAEGLPLDEKKGLKNLIQLNLEFLTILDDSILDCPVTVRRLWNQIRQVSHERWGKEVDHYILFRFVQVICQQMAAVAQVRDLSPEKTVILNSTFKIFEELGNSVYSPSFKEFVEENRPVLERIFEDLINDYNVNVAMAVLAASKHAKPGASKIFQARIKFDTFYNAISIHAPRSSSFSAGNPAVDTKLNVGNADGSYSKEQLDELISKIDSPTWKLHKNKDNIVSYLTNFGDNEVKAIKIVARVKSPLVSTGCFFGRAISHPLYNDCLSKTEIFQVSPTNFLTVMSVHPPWPLTRRQSCSKRSVIATPKEEAFYFLSVDYDFTPLKGYMRVHPKVSGFKMESDKKDPAYTIVTFVDDFHCGGNLPAWFVNRFRNVMRERFVKIAKDCESPERDEIEQRMTDNTVHGPLPEIYQIKKKEFNESKSKSNRPVSVKV
eukprot:TRINITY_DN4903_c0_g1_i1.p1 TRINITY_DN4903_c0_g1~~TRINITY_DN4903_c0_g1_i1.p1  ORF type:complete len:577 (+),score=180.85 TRINITY_DN4903_c0_g1_i1:225-1955(+)